MTRADFIAYSGVSSQAAKRLLSGTAKTIKGSEGEKYSLSAIYDSFEERRELAKLRALTKTEKKRHGCRLQLTELIVDALMLLYLKERNYDYGIAMSFQYNPQNALGIGYTISNMPNPYTRVLKKAKDYAKEVIAKYGDTPEKWFEENKDYLAEIKEESFRIGDKQYYNYIFARELEPRDSSYVNKTMTDLYNNIKACNEFAELNITLEEYEKRLV